MAILVLLIGIGFIIFAITVLKIHPFLALFLAAILVGVLAPMPLTASVELRGELEGVRRQLEQQVADGTLSRQEFSAKYSEKAWTLQEDWQRRRGRPSGQAILALEFASVEFGSTAGSIGLVIVLAAIIGQCLVLSGAADKITRRAIALLGEERAPMALMISGYVLAIPVFFDTVFFLLVPLARALLVRVGKNYVLFLLAICTGGVITHSLVPPTPGPLIMVENLGLDLGVAIALGTLLGIPAAAAGLLFAGFMNRRLTIPMRDVAGSSKEELEAIVKRSESELPGFWLSILPVLLPVLLITGDTLMQTLQRSGSDFFPAVVYSWSAFAGDKATALFVAAFLAAAALKRQKRMSLGELGERLEPALLSAGLIVLITSAGGAFGKMLSRAGISESLVDIFGNLEGDHGFLLILLAWGLASAMKVAQGSGTVSMITTSGMMAAMLSQFEALPFHMIYVYAAVGFGSLAGSWMNDSGFWVVCKLGGMTERETLGTWTLLLVVIGVAGLIQILIASTLFPLVP